MNRHPAPSSRASETTSPKPLAYVAGPYANPDPIVNIRRAVEVGELLVGRGYAVIVPHLTMLWHLVIPHDPDEWYARDLDLLAHCDVLFRIPGESFGADQEVKFAEANGIPVEEWVE
jgi:hypothetical protein